MRCPKRGRTGAQRCFTLIELLVVVAIIALLIAILLPSLNKARKQARTSLCMSRLGQLTKGMFLYAEDFAETPPFLGMGYENLKHPDYKTYYGHPGSYWARLENWLMPDMPDYWLTPQTGWPDHADVRNGTLFPYSRFETLYRCPEFERVGLGRKSQGVFNYTRGITCRKALSSQPPLSDKEAGDAVLTAGPILKPSQIYAPATMWMLFDEQWDFHCAAPGDQLNGKCGSGLPASGLVNFWMGIETIQCIAGDVLGSYHANSGKTLNYQAVKTSEMGSLSYYDGHVALFRDPLPSRAVDIYAPDFNEAAAPAANELANMMIGQIFSQRGVSLTVEALVAIFAGG